MTSTFVRIAAAAVFVAGALCACSAGDTTGSSTQGVSGAAYTTFDRDLGGCAPGSTNGINCNHYVCQDRVYVTGGPNRRHGGNTLENGTYYFAVLAPGSQNGGAADGAAGNLSDNVAHGGTDLGSGDTIADRTFTMTDGVLSYSGPHAVGTSPNGQPIVGLATFDTTPNPGGVYILAICPVGSSDPADCKFDAFKTDICGAPPPPPCDPKCIDSWGCVACPPPSCDPSCDPHSCSNCTPCIG